MDANQYIQMALRLLGGARVEIGFLEMQIEQVRTALYERDEEIKALKAKVAEYEKSEGSSVH